MSESKTAFITGVSGQDGAHIAAQLIADGWKVFGGYRRGSSSTTWRLEHFGITDQIELVECQLTEPQNLIEVMQTIQPAQVFHLAGESFVADSFKSPGVTLDVNTHGAINLLEAVRLVSPRSKVFCASSSEVFGSDSSPDGINENSPFGPRNPYAISKLAALNFVRLYRERYGIFACSGILFNHESPLRGRSFVTRKITFNIARLKVEGGLPVNLGNLDAARDWGSATDYVRAMRNMLELEDANDLVIASGKLTTVRQFFRIAAVAAGFDPVFENEGINEVCYDRATNMPLAQVSDRYFRVNDTPPLRGDATRIKQLTNWRPKQSLEDLISGMVTADIGRWKSGATSV